MAGFVGHSDWKDRQIHSPKPQPNTCGLIIPEADPDQELVRLDYAVPPALCKLGENYVSVRILDRIRYRTGQDIALEKVEIHVDYGEWIASLSGSSLSFIGLISNTDSGKMSDRYRPKSEQITTTMVAENE